MHLLVFASTPPPVHGQSLMVQTLLDGLPSAAPGLAFHHVNPRLSRDAADIGRWRPGKLPALLAACARALRLRLRHGPLLLYYVPAPARRAPLYRDWLVLLLCRPFCRALVLHWHAVGLGAWLATRATPPERWLTRLLLGRADLALVLAPALAADAAVLAPRRTAIVPNGLDLPAPSPIAHHPSPIHLLFLGLCSREKGLFDALDALVLVNRHAAATGTRPFHLTVAGEFPDAATRHAFSAAARTAGDTVHHVGFVTGAAKTQLLRSADILLFPTAYPHEAQPLVLLEALAADLPIVATRWRAIPDMLPASPHVRLVAPHRPDELAAAVLALRDAPPPAGTLRAHYLAHFTRDRHLAALAAALVSIASPPAGR